MEIIGRKYLDRNDYDSVIITPKLIRVFGDDNYDTIKSSILQQKFRPACQRNADAVV